MAFQWTHSRKFACQSSLWYDELPEIDRSKHLQCGIMVNTGKLIGKTCDDTEINDRTYPFCKLGRDCTNSSRTPPENCQCTSNLCLKGQYCLIKKTSSSCIEECKPFPTFNTNTCGCNKALCTPGQVCNLTNSACWSVPKCQPMPATQIGCSCNKSDNICTEGEMCGKSFCSKPAVCENPRALEEWQHLNMTADVSGRFTAFEGDTIILTCKEHHFLFIEEDKSTMKMTNKTKYNSTCDHNGAWNKLNGCSLILCKPLKYVTNTSVEIEILETPVEGTENNLNSKIKVSCQNEGDDFDFGLNIISVEYQCGHRGWKVSEKYACPDGSSECDSPSIIGCSFKGCEIPKKHDQSFDVLFLGPERRALRDFTSNAICGGENETILQVYMFENKSLLAMKTEYCENGTILQFIEDNNETLKYLGFDSTGSSPCNIQTNATLQEASCFTLRFDNCAPNFVSLESVDQPGIFIKPLNKTCGKISQCMRITISENMDAMSSFFVSKQYPELLAENKEELENQLVNTLMQMEY